MSEGKKRAKRPYRSTRRANGAMLRYLREGAELTQEELQELSGISHTQISRIETGESIRPRKGTLTRLANALNVNVERLVIREAPPDVPDLPMQNEENQHKLRSKEEEWDALEQTQREEEERDGAEGGAGL